MNGSKHTLDEQPALEPAPKRLKKAPSAPKSSISPVDAFAPGLLDHNSIARFNSFYSKAAPFKHAVVDQLFADDLLRKVKDECLNELSFSEKETDIYKIQQTGDLASLNYLEASQLALFPNLLALRNALYSAEFRSFLRAVTGCGPLSGIKQDMSIAQYTKSCHLLNHDDVIGTRRVSYILYMPLPDNQVWQKDWGGALELYPVRPITRPTENGEEEELEPESIPSKIVPPSWNQFVFFEVQPGRSFHSVEEVVVGDDAEFTRSRMSISGWFHAAQEGEDGYVSEYESQAMKSSRDQLAATQTIFTPYPESAPIPDVSSSAILPEDFLPKDDVIFLSQFMNSVYLQPRTMSALAQRFVDNSSIDLHIFLKKELADALQKQILAADSRDGLSSKERGGKVPPHMSGVGDFEIKGPPHKHRYAVLNQSPSRSGSPSSNASSSAVAPLTAAPLQQILHTLEHTLFSSTSFRAWLCAVAKLLPLGYAVEARRFRPGLDYMLARSEEKEVRLDVCLGLTPGPEEGRDAGWVDPEWGGWECYMAPHDEDQDPAVYRSSGSKTSKPPSDTVSVKPNVNGNGAMNGVETAESEGEDVDQDMDEDEDDSTLLTVQPGFNKLLLVLRDERVMRFVKYVSAAAPGSRWDVCAEYEVGQVVNTDESESDN
ncbi:Oxoglutarate and iron-dependent oxygenase degradation C-term-domain-containing protein [Flagelloscypha sp. PMI_526]|nr:Oxoglutarate and iron-dependent oxygenase degradation C-term-domain-containing protein [Flagelloscypha sp. PMI_526]